MHLEQVPGKLNPWLLLASFFSNALFVYTVLSNEDEFSYDDNCVLTTQSRLLPSDPATYFEEGKGRRSIRLRRTLWEDFVPMKVVVHDAFYIVDKEVRL